MSKKFLFKKFSVKIRKLSDVRVVNKLRNHAINYCTNVSSDLRSIQ